MFPLGDLTKKEVREIARAHNLPVSDKKDSTGICFIGNQKFDEFITQHLQAIPGDIIDENGKVLELNQSFSSLLSNEDNTNKNKKIYGL